MSALSPVRTTAIRAPTQDNHSVLYLQLQSRKPPPQSFIYAVLTTKIYCLPTCPSRLARRANVRFYANPAQAAAAGFRPCKRCKPEECFCELPSPLLSPSSQQPDYTPPKGITAGNSSSPALECLSPVANKHDTPSAVSAPPFKQSSSDTPVLPSARRQATAVQQACALIRRTRAEGRRAPLQEVASSVGMTRWHFGRIFRRIMGIGPGEWARKLEMGKGVSGGSENLEDGVGEAGEVVERMLGDGDVEAEGEEGAKEAAHNNCDLNFGDEPCEWTTAESELSSGASPLSWNGADWAMQEDSQALTMTSEELAVWDAFFESDGQMLGLATAPTAACVVDSVESRGL